MREEWRNYWREFLRYKQYPLWGLGLSFLPFLFSYPYWKSRGTVWLGLLVSVNVSLSITLMIYVFTGIGFAILTIIQIRTGLELKRLGLLQVILVGLGVTCGVWLGMFTNSLILNQSFQVSHVLPPLLLSGIASLGFGLHIAYRKAKEEALTMQAAVAESKYNALEHQMRPHFLFNALNSLAEMIESGHERAAEMTYHLSDLYRLILNNSKMKTAPLESELDIARRYLELEKLRFGPRLDFRIEVTEPARSAYIPSLVIQTLVENAIKHGIAKSVGGGLIEIDVRQAPEGLYQLTVANTGEPFIETAAVSPTGTGLANTRARLELLYGSKHQFGVRADGDGKTVIRFFFTGEKLD